MIKQRFKKAYGARRGAAKEAKVGFGVGKHGKANRSGNNRGGVGVSGQNIHWFVLGTNDRELTKGSEKGPSAGHPTGRIENVFAGLAAHAVTGSRQQALQTATKIYQDSLRKAATRK